jgi:glycosyltransferase involved in cell wall biosynthesis
MNVIIRAPLLSVSGYGVHSRQIYTFLEESKRNFNIEAQSVNWGNTSWLVNPDLEDGQVGRIMRRSEPLGSVADISFQVQLPDEWDPNLAKRNIGVSAVVETDRCNPEWVDACNKMDAVIVPSEHARLCLERSGDLRTKVTVIPEWFFTQISDKNKVNTEMSNFQFDTDFNFLIVSQINGTNAFNDRKNIFFTIRWICEQFKDDPNVGIVLKTNSGRNTLIDRNVTLDLVKSLINEVRPGNFPKIHLVHGNLYPAELVDLYKNDRIKALVNLTRGEGFGLPILEAAASNLPVIATNWSAHKEFLSIGKFIDVDYNLIEIPESKIDNRIFIKSSMWADPIENDFKKKISKFRNKPDIPKTWSQRLGEKIRNKYSKESILGQYETFIDEML